MTVKRAVVMVSIVVCAAGVVSAQTIWEDQSGNPVLPPGPSGAWDEGGRMVGSVVYDGAMWHLYYLNFDPAIGTEAIGHATSATGLPPWEIDDANNPVLEPGSSGAWDEDRLFLPTVIFDGSMFHMWYTGVQGSYAQGGYATSPDGSTWTKDYVNNPVLPVGLPGEWDSMHARPGAVVSDGGTLKMWYSGLGSTNNVQIGYAESTDGGITWIKHPEPVLNETTDPVWDQRVANPSVVLIGGRYFMLYAGYDQTTRWWRTGFALSSDGLDWRRYDNDNPVFSVVGEHTGASPFVFDGVTFHAWFGHYPFDVSTVASSYATSTSLIFGDGFETGSTSLWSTTVP